MGLSVRGEHRWFGEGGRVVVLSVESMIVMDKLNSEGLGEQTQSQGRDWLRLLFSVQLRIVSGRSSEAYLLLKDLENQSMPSEIQADFFDLLGFCLTELSQYSAALRAYKKSLDIRTEYGSPIRRTTLGLAFSALRSLCTSEFFAALDIIRSSQIDSDEVLQNVDLEVRMMASDEKCLWDPYVIGVGEYLSPQQLRVWNKALAASLQGDASEALTFARQVQDEAPFSLPVRLFTIKVLEASRQFHESRMTVEDTLADYPESWRAFCWAGRIALKHRDYPEAERYLRKAIDLYAESGEAWYLLGMCLSRLGQMDEALLAFHTALRYLRASGPPLSLRELGIAEGALAGCEIATRRYLRGALRSIRSLMRIARFVRQCWQTFDEIKRCLRKG